MDKTPSYIEDHISQLPAIQMLIKTGYQYKGFDKQYYLDLIIKAIKEHKELSRQEIDELLWNKLPDWMDEKQKNNKVRNLSMN